MGLDIVEQCLLITIETGLIDVIVELGEFLLADGAILPHLTELSSITARLFLCILIEEVHLVVFGIESRAIYVIAVSVGIPEAHFLARHKWHKVETWRLHVAAQQPGLNNKSFTEGIHLEFKLKLAILSYEGLFFVA